MMLKRGGLLDWFLPLEKSCSLDELSSQWTGLLERHHLCAGYEDPKYQAAVLSFLARSKLPAKLKFGVFLLQVPSLDLDARLAIGALGPALDSCWVAPASADPCVEGDLLDAESKDRWRLGFLQGRLTEVWHSLRKDRGPSSFRVESNTDNSWS